MKNAHDSPPKVMVVNCWHDSNKGDAAITIGILNALTANGLGQKLGVSSYAMYSTDEAQKYAFRHVLAAYPEVEVVPTSVPALASSVGAKTALRLAFRGIVKLIYPDLLKDRPMEKAIRESSIVVSTGGLYFGFVESNFGHQAFHLFAHSYPLLFARRLGIPYLLYAQSFGPFHGWFARWWMRRLIAASAGTWSRESYSQSALVGLGADLRKLDIIADAAFGIELDKNRQQVEYSQYGLIQGNYIALSLRGLCSTGHDADVETNYRQIFLEIIEWLVKDKDLQVVLMAHTMGPLEKEDDRIVSKEIWSSLEEFTKKKTILITDDLSPAELAELYGSAKLVIATRFHAVVLAVCGGAPIVAIPYFGLKTQGSLRDLGLSEFMIELPYLTFGALQTTVNRALAGEGIIRNRIGLIARERYQAAIKTGERTLHLIARRSDCT